jgi:flagellar hook-length control protein FliK
VHEVRLSESVSTVRAQDSVRSAVENPTMRADMARQFSDIMARAQVLVTDSQNAQFSVKLYPRDLGRMQIDLKLIDGEIRGKIVVESEDVKNEMQNFLQNRDQQGSEQQLDLNRIDIEVRNGNQYAQNSQETADPDELLQNLVTRVATDAYEQTTSATSTAKGLYA